MLAIVALIGSTVFGLTSASKALAQPAAAGRSGHLPCDLYAQAGTPCVGAHSTTL